MQATYLERNFLNPQLRFAHAAKRGLLLSHLIGLTFFASFIFGPALLNNFLLTKPLEWPIRILAIWLLVDRLGKAKRVQFSAWDWVQLLFVAGYGAALIYAELFMMRDMGLSNYIQWGNIALDGYLYFLVVREGISRRGFNVEVVLHWMVATFFVVCLLALAQARDFAGLRSVIDGFYHQAHLEQHMEGPSQPWQARAPASHSNSLAIMLLAGLPIFVALADLKKLRWYDWVVCGLMILTIFMTYSRTGIIGLVGAAVALAVAFAVRRQYVKATITAISLATIATLFVAIVISFDVSRYKVLTEGNQDVSSSGSKETAGWQLRKHSLERSILRAEDYPVLGLSAASGALNQETVIVRNAYTYSGLLLNVYAYAFVSYGLLGVLYIAALFWLILSQCRYLRTRQAFSAALFVVGLTMVVAGISENVLFFDGAMISVNILMACGVMKVAVPSRQDETTALPKAA